MQARGDGQGGLVHAAHHHLQARGPGHSVDGQGLVDAAHLHQLDVDHVGQAAVGDAEGVPQPQQALVGHHRHRHPAGHAAQQLGQALGRGLLQQLQAGPPCEFHEAHRLLHGVALVGVEAQFHGRTQSLAHQQHPLRILIGVEPPLELERGEAVATKLQGLLHGLLRRQDADGHAGAYAVAEAAEQLEQRLVRGLGHEIVQRHVHRGQGRWLAGQGFVQAVQQPHPAQRIGAPQCRPHHVGERGEYLVRALAGDVVVGRGAAQPGVRAAGVQAQHHVGRLLHSLVGDGVGGA